MATSIERRRALTRERVRRFRERRRAERATAAAVALQAKLHAPATAAPATAALDWIEQNLVVPAGPLRGKPFKLGGWQRSFITDAMAPGIREAALCVARKNGKTALVSAIVLAHLAGPWSRPDWRGIVASLNADLALELRHAVTLTAAMSGLRIDLQKSPRPGAVHGPSGAMCQFLAADKGTGHAKGADLAIIDEAGLLDERARAMWNAMLSSTSGRDGRLLAISILGDGPMMAELRDRAGEETVCWHGYTTEPRDDPCDPGVWRRANPGLDDGIKSESYMRDMAARALANPADMAQFRAYDLNAPGSPTRELIVSMEQYEPARQAPAPRTARCVVGIDLGGSASMTAAAAYWADTGRLEVKAALPGIPDLDARQAADGVGNRYERMKEAGELDVYAGVRTTPVRLFLTAFLKGLADVEIVAIAADRYRQSEAEDVFAAVGLLRPARIWRGMGWVDASEDVRAFQRSVIDQKLRVGESLLLESAIVESALAIDAAGNQKLDKQRHRGRIDALSAAVLAVSEGERLLQRPRRRPRYLGVIR